MRPSSSGTVSLNGGRNAARWRCRAGSAQNQIIRLGATRTTSPTAKGASKTVRVSTWERKAYQGGGGGKYITLAGPRSENAELARSGWRSFLSSSRTVFATLAMSIPKRKHFPWERWRRNSKHKKNKHSEVGTKHFCCTAVPGMINTGREKAVLN